MVCESNVCGTGGWKGPLPGDPDNNVTLSANNVYGGINVSWSWPVTNGNAVAHTLLYRGLTADYATAVQLSVVGGSIYYDRLDPAVNTTYFYWIQIVSVNGTVGDVIGPVSADAQPLGQQTLSSLTGLIDSGVLATSLKTSIAGITTNNDLLNQEIQDRLLANDQLSQALAGVQSGVDQSMTFINQEITDRKDGINAVVDQVNIIAGANRDAFSAIDTETQVRVAQHDALAKSITDLTSTVDGNYSDIQITLQTHTDDIGANAQSITDLGTKYDGLNTALAAVKETADAASDANSATANRVTTVEATVNGDTATGEVGLTTKVTTIDGKVTDIGSLYTAKVQVDGLIGGFGVYNDGTEVEAGFDVDRFWVGRTYGTGTNAVKPFIVDNDVVYMDVARIRDADITSLKLAGSAVTVPITARTNNVLKGTGLNNWKTLIAGYIKLDIPGIVYAHCICFQVYGQGVRKWQMRISINGTIGTTVGAQSVVDTPVIAQSLACPAGVIPVVVEWCGENDGVSIHNADLFIIGAKR